MKVYRVTWFGGGVIRHFHTREKAEAYANKIRSKYSYICKIMEVKAK